MPKLLRSALVTLGLLLVAFLGYTIGGAWAMTQQRAPEIIRVGPTKRVQPGEEVPGQISPSDTLKVLRYGIDTDALRYGIFVACYLTNPKVYKGTPSLSCVGVPVPSQVPQLPR